VRLHQCTSVVGAPQRRIACLPSTYSWAAPAVRAPAGSPIRSSQAPERSFGEEGLLLCSPYKEHLTAYLEEHYDTFLSGEICAAVPAPSAAAKDQTGYRMVQPQERSAAEESHALAEPIGQER